MKKLISILILLSSFGLFADKPIVAVLEIENKASGKNGLSNDEVELIAELMRSEMIQTNEFNVMRKDEMEAAIAQHVKKSHQLNRDSNYAIELGKTISARYIITSKILKDGTSFRISAEMIDTEIGRSPRSGNAKFRMDDDDSKDKAIVSLIKQLLGEREESLHPKKSEDQIECEKARVENISESWEAYLEFYPNGVCAKEAKEKLDEIACQQASRSNTIEAWQEYLDNFNGNCRIEASKNIKKLKKAASRQYTQSSNSQISQTQSSAQDVTVEKVGSLYWSEVAPKKMNYNEANNYCRRLNEGGISGWRLPTIDELRTVVQNCKGTVPGGACRVSEVNGCLASNCLSSSCQCGANSTGKYSILGDSAIYLWSSSFKSNDRVYLVDFSRGGINSQYVGNSYNVRCVK